MIEASSSYKKVIALNPNFAEAYSNMGNALQDQGKFDEAVETYQKALLLNPNYIEAYSNMGNALKNRGEFNEAIEAFKKAIQKRITDVDFTKLKTLDEQNRKGEQLHNQEENDYLMVRIFHLTSEYLLQNCKIRYVQKLQK